MPRPLVIGNGNLLINLDNNGYIRDLFYPFVGQMNHVGGYYCRIGIWMDGQFLWLNDASWETKLAYESDSLVTRLIKINEKLGISLIINDGVHQRENIYLRRITIENLDMKEKEIRLFFHQDLQINGNAVGDTAVYYPLNNTVFHYKKDRYFMFNGRVDENGMDQYTTGVKRFHFAEGTWRDAEDGHLMGNSIAQGSIDSTFRLRFTLAEKESKQIYYWMSAGKSLEEVVSLDQYVLESEPTQLLDRVKIYWQRWVNKVDRDYADLNPEVVSLFKQSLLLVRTQVDKNGAIIAANDTDILQYNRDHYSYLWPRDGALVAYAMSMAGYQGMVAPFFQFCANALTTDGYLHHKYNPDGTVGSSWHPYITNGEIQLPIQEDETALVLFALWKNYENDKDIEFPQSQYRGFIRKAANFLATFVDEELQLPKPSYDLWEERYGIWTFTASAVYGGLMAAANFSVLFGDDRRSERYRQTAETIKQGILKHLWDDSSNRFIRGLVKNDKKWEKDNTLESSLFGVFEFGVLPAQDERVIKTMKAIREGLSVNTEIGGIARYHHDYYFQKSSDIEKVPGNPWIICTLWMAEFEIEAANTLEDLTMAHDRLKWVAMHAMESGILSEQVDPLNGSPISVAPLTWSHATYVLVITKYLKKYEDINSM